MNQDNWRNSTQYQLPPIMPEKHPGQYDVFPAFSLHANQIKRGFSALADQLQSHSIIIIDGYNGVFWEHFREQLDAQFKVRHINATWINVATALKPESEIDALLESSLGEDDPLFGIRFTGTLHNFFNEQKLAQFQSLDQVTILYGVGAALANWQDAYLVYVDLPKNEIQYRSRAGAITNLGAVDPSSPKAMYKRFYFVEWFALNQHKEAILPRIDLIVDEQRPDDPALMTGKHLRAGLQQMAHNFFRVRPWFEPGVWGGSWIKTHIKGVSSEVPNYAWSFELITPENGLIFESSGNLLEVSFDFLMYAAHSKILGYAAGRFGYEFPIRFNFLDTFDGGNLSVQCHPSLEYIHAQFGENLAGDETYYILDCKPGAKVHIGFQDDVTPESFEQALRHSFEENQAIDIYQYVNFVQPQKHDLILIPYNTIHGSGKNNLVLEISSTPYIFTFKLYDWVRPDLNGKLRPLNIERGIANLNFERRGDRVFDELVAKPCVIQRGRDWELFHLKPHPHHIYDIYRYEFDSEIVCDTGGNQMHIMSLVEGTSIILETEYNKRQRFNYVETFVVSAAAGRYKLINESDTRARVVQVFIKKG